MESSRRLDYRGISIKFSEAQIKTLGICLEVFISFENHILEIDFGQYFLKRPKVLGIMLIKESMKK